MPYSISPQRRQASAFDNIETKTETVQTILRRLLAPITSGEQQVQRTMLGLAICTGISQFAGVLVFIILAKALTPLAFGKLSGAVFLQQLLTTIGIAGIRNVVIRECIQNPEVKGLIGGSYLFLSSGIGLLTLLCTALTVSFLPIGYDEKLAYLLIAFGHLGACLFPGALFDAEHLQVEAAVITTICEVGSLIVFAICWWIDWITVPSAAVLFAAKWFVSAIIGLMQFKLRHPACCLRVDYSTLLKLWRSARVLSLGTMLNVAPAALGVTLTRILFGPIQAGMFAVAAFVFRTHATLIGLFTRTIYPHVIGKFGETKSFKRRLFAAYLGVTTTLTIVGAFCSELMIRYLLPMEFKQSRWMIALMLIAATVRVGGIIGNMYLIAHQKEGRLTTIAIFGVMAFALTLLIPLDIAGGSRMALAIIASSAATLLSLVRSSAPYTLSHSNERS
jgi:O-antigen/teichoic acid export membrane protein